MALLDKKSTMKGDSDQPEWYTPVSEILPIVERAHAVSASRITHPASFRRSQLLAILRILTEHEADLAAAIEADLGQGLHYSYSWEIQSPIHLARTSLENLDEWMAPKIVPTPFPYNLNVPTWSSIEAYPRGVALIITPWNFPVTLVLKPLIDALAAGNVCVLKQSERCLHSTRLLTRLIKEHLDPRAVMIVNGGVPQSAELLRHRFDAIAYTGGEAVGKIVAAAAAKHLTPTLLELGGKNPAIICDDADIKSATMRIAWAKICGNMGQLCMSPDYVLVSQKSKQKVVAALKDAFRQFYTDDPKSSPDVGRLISVEHASRVAAMIDGTCTVLHGGESDLEGKYVAPTIVEATADSTIMQDEVFGPILSIVTIPDSDNADHDEVDGAIRFVNTHFSSKGRHPLGLYLFSKSKKNQRRILNGIPSGMACVNDLIKQGGSSFLPFGGVGTSGMGAGHGKHGFDFFTHHRGSLSTNNVGSSKYDPAVWMTFPPSNSNKLKALRMVNMLPQIGRGLKQIATILAPVVLAVLCYKNSGLLDAALDFNLRMLMDWIFELFR